MIVRILLALFVLIAPAHAADAWPQRPIRFIVGFAPGGSADVLARWLAEPVSRALGQQVVVGKLPYNPETDLTAITQLASYPNVVVVHPGVPAKTMAELVTWLHAHPGEGYAIPGVGSSPHLVGETLNKRFDLKLQQVPYRSG